MRNPRPIAAAALAFALASSGAHAMAPTVAVFNFEFLDTSLERSTNGPRADEQARLIRLGDELRNRLASSGRIGIGEVGPVVEQVWASNWQACGGCDVRFARELGAKFSVTGWVQKVSNLILNVNVAVRDADTGRLLGTKSVDMRGNTDESWSRALDWLVRNYPLAPEPGVFR